MGMRAEDALAQAKAYTKKSLASAGALKGADGVSPTIDINKVDGVTTISITDVNSTKTATILDGTDGEKGEAGKDGTTYTPVIGTITTVDSGNDATAEILLDDEAKTATFNFFIPKGETGERGEDAVIDTELDEGSTNAVANSVIASKFSELFSDDASVLTISSSTTNTTLGVAVSQSFAYNVVYNRIGKVHFLQIQGGGKIINTTTTTYETTLTIEVPSNFYEPVQLNSSMATAVTSMEEPTYTYGGSSLTITLVYQQGNSTSSYSPDSLFYIGSTFVLIEK